ncbi:MAG: FkbM family methyltransferase [Oligoflexia bacterium]|nr:FkbM family methyltransferase [Oligoflexia bacterium]
MGCASEIERYRIDSYEHKEPETLDWIDENFGPGDVLFDIGANIGIYTLYAAKRNSKGQVYAFEPEAQNFARICRNIVVNQIQNVVPCNFALADHSGYNKFFVSAGDVGSSMHSFGKVSDFAENGRAMIQQGTIAFTLDDAVNKLGLPCPQLIKLDVDGLEEQILDGAKSILLSGRVRSLLVELSFRDKGHLDSQMHRILNLGFKKRLESQWSYSAAGMTSKNYLFSRDH